MDFTKHDDDTLDDMLAMLSIDMDDDNATREQKIALLETVSIDDLKATNILGDE